MTPRLKIAAVTLACLTTIAGAIVWLMQPAESDSRPVEIYLDNTKLIVPPAYLRFEHSRFGGRQTEIDIAANAKTFKPAKLQSKYRPDGPDPMAQVVFLTLTAAAGKISPADRTTRLYARFLQPGDWSHPGGLIMRRFKNGSPYQKEDLYMAPPEGRLFAARCPRPRQPPDGLTEICMAELRLDNVDIRVRFSADLLADWEQVYNGTRGLVHSFMR